MPDWSTWYNQLSKPSWTPPGSTIGIIWTILYPIILVSLGLVIFKLTSGKIKFITALPFLLNLVLNLAFTPIQFGLRNLTLAWVDIILVWTTILWSIISIWPYSRSLALIQIPYLTWVTIASYLQTFITFNNLK